MVLPSQSALQSIAFFACKGVVRAGASPDTQQRCFRRVHGGVLGGLEPLESRRLLSTYYVSASGHDNASGTSTSSAWHSIDARVDHQKLKAGDKVLFQGGKTFSGSLSLNSHEGEGTSSSPIVFGTYGSGRATIQSGKSTGFDIAETGGVSISNLPLLSAAGCIRIPPAASTCMPGLGEQKSLLDLYQQR